MIAIGYPAADEVPQVTALINEVYAVAEDGLWPPGTDRTTVDEVAAFTAAGEMVLARDGAEVAGAVRVQRLPGGVGEFGMLVAAPGHRGAGVGRDLVAYAENWARREGLPTMQLELLVPQTWQHPVKEFLRGWYTRLGYRAVRKGVFADDFPALAARLATPCDFLVFHKRL